MSDRHSFKIEVGEKFENLPDAPIVEAVIHWQARSKAIEQPEAFYDQLKNLLVDYPSSHAEHEIEFQAEIGSVGVATKLSSSKWTGFKFTSTDKLHVAQFTRDGFAFSRLKPYEDWACFEKEALRLWQVYVDLANPIEVQRLGVRFINSISPVDLDDAGELLVVPPKCPKTMDLPLTNFVHQNSFVIPRSNYNLNIIQTIQPSSPAIEVGPQLILDIDVFTMQVSEVTGNSLTNQLREMRWIKNKAFFSFLSPTAINRFRE